jgi:hypothetical protein
VKRQPALRKRRENLGVPEGSLPHLSQIWGFHEQASLVTHSLQPTDETLYENPSCDWPDPQKRERDITGVLLKKEQKMKRAEPDKGGLCGAQYQNGDLPRVEEEV